MHEKPNPKKPEALTARPKTYYVAGKKMDEAQYKKHVEKTKLAQVELKKRAEQKAK